MAMREVNGIALYCEEEGQGQETLSFSHGLLFNAAMWDAQVQAFGHRYRCVRYDHRGQGRSQRKGLPDMDTLAEDAATLIRSLNTGPVHFVGLSMGGFVGMRVAARHPELLRSLILLNTSASAERNTRKYRLLNTVVRLLGTKAVSSRVQPILFGRTTLADPAQQDMVARWKTHLESLPRDVTQAVKGVISRQPILGELGQIRCPALVLAGEEDLATPPSRSREIASHLPGARLEILSRIGHMSVLEAPVQVHTHMEAFLQDLP
jgi:3-oxoadipate enol-lactonase